METTNSPRISTRGLNLREQEKLDRLLPDIVAACSVSGRSVRACQATIQDGRRLLQFLPDFDQQPIAVIDATDFISDTAEELAAQICDSATAQRKTKMGES